MAEQSSKKWYELLPWWGWVISIVVSSQLSTYLSSNFSGLIPVMVAAGLGFFVLYSLGALVVWLFTIPSRRKRESSAE